MCTVSTVWVRIMTPLQMSRPMSSHFSNHPWLQPEKTASLLSVSHSACSRQSTQMGSHGIWSFCRASFMQLSVFVAPLWCRACQQVILLHGQITSVVHHTWMHPLVCICSLFNGHLGCSMFWRWWIILLSMSVLIFHHIPLLVKYMIKYLAHWFLLGYLSYHRVARVFCIIWI